ncbi:MAG: NADH-quinone oxidoreductase subunit J [Candidatus Binatia bacterium]
MGTILFLVLAVLTIAAALGVILHPNPVKSALFLIVTLFLLAVVFVLLEAHMIAALQIIVYAGAIMVLFLFVIMLLNLQIDDPDRGRRQVVLRGLAWLGGIILAVELALLVRGGPAGNPAAAPAGYGGALAVAQSLYTDFLLPFELTSILLLVAVVGAVVLAQKQRRPTIS